MWEFNHITPAFVGLHWLPIKFRVQLKLLLIVCKSLHNQAPHYINYGGGIGTKMQLNRVLCHWTINDMLLNHTSFYRTVFFMSLDRTWFYWIIRHSIRSYTSCHWIIRHSIRSYTSCHWIIRLSIGSYISCHWIGLRVTATHHSVRKPHLCY